MEVEEDEFELYAKCKRCKRDGNYEFVEVDYVVASCGYWDIFVVACDQGADAGAVAD